MSAYRMLDVLGRRGEPAFLRRAFILPTLIYPLWHLAAPAAARDPWLIWWLVGSSFSGVGLLSLYVPYVERNLLSFFHLCSWLVTAQLAVLAHANSMHPFYAVGSVMAMLATFAFIRTLPNFLAYAGFLMVLCVALFVLDPDLRKLAYWGGLLPVAAGSYHRLSVQLIATRAAREHQEQLEQRVAERTADLSASNRRLREEMEKRERLEEELRFAQKLEAVGRLAGGVAHDFNNLLTTITVYADLVHASVPAESLLREEVEQIQKTVRQAADLTQQLLTFSRRRDVETEILEAGEVIRKTGSMLEHLLGEDIELVLDLDPAPRMIQANIGQLEQVLVNLALNARDAMRKGGRFAIETRLVRASDPRSAELADLLDAGDYVLIASEDSGVGMDAETRTRAFDPFFTRKQVDEGTGLGLSTIYGVVKQAGGHVRLQSEPDRGARFELYWPWADEKAAVRSAATVTSPSKGGDEHILLVEDDEDLRRALVRVLDAAGYHVSEAADADSALEIAARAETPFDLVITDVVMPHKSGFELVSQLEKDRPGSKVLMMSGHLNHPSLREHALPRRTTLLSKPFTSDGLTTKVREVLDGEVAV